jgi:ATP-binding cassette subfamily F protein 3
VLDADARMLDDLSSIAPRVPTTDLRNLLGCFLFSGDDAFKPLGVLSGGERNRYALARILVSPANFLLLDEPTNHLDLRAKDVLLEAVRNFSGTVVFVSHDRYFIDGLATRVFEVEGGKVHVYPGNYEDFLRSKAGSVAPATANGSANPNGSAPAVTPKATETTGEQSADAPKGRRLNPIRIKQMRERLQFVEEEIPRVEAGISDAEQALGIFVSVDETQQRTEELARLRAEHESLSREWEELVTLLEEQASV